MFANGTIAPSQLSVKDLPWQIVWDKEKCTLCGRCAAICPVRALEPGVFRKRAVQNSFGLKETPVNEYSLFYGIRQQTDPART